MKTFVRALTCVLFAALLAAITACAAPQAHEIRFVDGETTVHTLRTAGKERIALPDPLIDHHPNEVFEGWFFEEDTPETRLTETYYLDSALTADVTVYAYWTDEENGGEDPDPEEPTDPVTYTVTFDSGEGSAIPAQSADRIDSEPIPSNPHFRFDGWFTDPDCTGNRVTFPFIVTRDTTLYAKWTQTEFSVTFVENGGSTVTDGWFDEIETQPQTDRSGYIFGGWYTDAACAEERITFPFAVTQTTTLYAKWTAEPELLEIDGFTISGTTASASYTAGTDSVNIEDAVTVSEGASWKAYYDEDLATEADASALPLNAGTNRFYLQVSAAGQSAVYTLVIELTDGYALTVYENGVQSTTLYANKGDTFASPLPQIYTQEKNFRFDGEYFADEEMTVPLTDFTADGNKTVYMKVWYVGYEYSSFIFTIQGALDSDLPILYAKIPNTIGSTPIYSLSSSFQNDFDFKKELKEVYIEEGIDSIENSAFLNSPVLEKVTLPDGIMLAGGVFQNCPNLAAVVCDGTIRSSSTNFSGTALYNDPANWENGAFYIGNYLAGYDADKASSQNFAVRSGTLSVAGSSFDDSTSLLSVDLGNCVKFIGNYAFDGCSSLASVTGMNAVESIGENAFRNTAYFNSAANWNGKLLYLHDWLIASDGFTGALTLQSGTVGIADGTFQGNANITSVDFGTALKYIGKYAFGYDSSGRNAQFTELRFPDSLLSVDEGAFRYQKQVTVLTFGDNLKFVGKNAFRNCTALAEIVFPQSLQTVQRWSFSNIASGAKLFLKGRLQDIRAEKEWNGYGSTKGVCYEYSDTPQEGNYWHYVDGVPTVWETA